MAEKWPTQAMHLANALREQEVLLLKMSDHLSDHLSLMREEIKGMATRYTMNFHIGNIVDYKSCAFYGQRLKERAEGKI